MLLLVVLLAMGQLGRANDRYVRAKDGFERAMTTMAKEVRPSKVDRNDPPGAQRWTYLDRELFNPDNTLSSYGRQFLGEQSKAIKGNGEWKRIRIEGRALPSKRDEPDSWKWSAAVAASTAELFQTRSQFGPL